MAQWSFHEAHLQVICLYNKAEIVVIYVWVGRKREGGREEGRGREGGRESEESSLPQPRTWLEVPGWGTDVSSLGWVGREGGRERKRKRDSIVSSLPQPRTYLKVGVFPD